MIYDKVENMGLYFNKLTGFEKVEEEYNKFCQSPIKEGRIDKNTLNPVFAPSINVPNTSILLYKPNRTIIATKIGRM